MTIGKKIKYIRGLYGWSSAKLAEESGIHPVSIRKYETDKMIPQQAQIDRIAYAFRLSPAVFSGVTDTRFDFQYSGDLLALLIMLYTSGGLIVSGEREANGALIPDSVKLSVNPLFNRFIQFSTSDSLLKPSDISIEITDNDTLRSFSYWEYMYNKTDDYHEKYIDEESVESKSAYEEFLNDYEEVEIKTLLSGRLRQIIDSRVSNN